MENLHKITENNKNNNFERFPDGRNKFKKGHQIGRMKKRGYTILDLTKVAMAYDKTHDETILKHYIEQLLKDNRLLENFINKYVPTKTISELTGADGEPLVLKFIIERTYENEGNKDKINPQTD